MTEIEGSKQAKFVHPMQNLKFQAILIAHCSAVHYQTVSNHFVFSILVISWTMFPKQGLK